MEEEYSKTRIKNFTIERNFLSGLYRYPESIYEVEAYLSDQEFLSPVAGRLYGIFRHLIIDKDVKRLDIPLILATISSMCLVFPVEVNISDYLTGIARDSHDIEYKTVSYLAKDILLMSKRREMWDCGTKLQQNMVEGHKFGNIQEIINVSDEIYFDAINDFVVDEDMELLGSGSGEDLHRRADNPVERMGISTSLPAWDEMIGGLRGDSFNFICARPKIGKSILGSNFARHIAEKEKIPVLYADSELNKTMMRLRMIAHISQVDIYYLETGKWKGNKEMAERVIKAIAINESLPITYLSIRGTNAQSLISSCRRFLFRTVKRGENGQFNKNVIIWDYIKLDVYNEKNISNNWWLDVAKSTVMFKDFLGKVGTTSGVVFGQQNSTAVARKDMKTGKTQNTDDSSSVALSDEINKSCSNVSILRMKNNDEIEKDGMQNGDCLIIPLFAREGRGSEWVKTSEGLFEPEYVCLERNKKCFTFREVNTNRKIRESQSLSSTLTNNH